MSALTPAQVKAIAYTVDRYPRMIGHEPLEGRLAEIREDYRAAYVQALETALVAIVEASQSWGPDSETVIREMLAAEL